MSRNREHKTSLNSKDSPHEKPDRIDRRLLVLFRFEHLRALLYLLSFLLAATAGSILLAMPLRLPAVGEQGLLARP